ncbi:hypothetical protein PPYR_01481 [Photinus pyralis]|uniref:diphthine methyl ester synthase n=1 Tax=Photinus pyralis TaxID=7054 RepID=A0A1Y1MLG7_PHOPY|nr:diphthine methyl ester synthase [Photinus pyralis]KAB0804511.1 hypothetical protein PPYR_01481 [Photinus pyralis]
MFYIIGLGLGDCKDVTVKGLEIIKKCDRIYLEHYTSILTCGISELESFYQKKLLIADRDLVEQSADTILQGADIEDVALLVVGDPYGATTHTDLILRAKEKNIQFQIIHNASILNAVGCCGLQLYSFGETISIPFWTENWKPDSFFNKILSNYQRNLHTLCLLDIKVKEPTLESLTKKKKEYMPPRFMSVSEATQQILEIINKADSGCDVTGNDMCIGLARVGSESQKIVACSISQMTTVDLGPPLHSLVIPSCVLHPLEEEYINQFKLN